MFSAASGRCHAISAPALIFLVPALDPVKLPTLHYVHPFVCVSVCNNDAGSMQRPTFSKYVYVCTVPFRLCNGPQRCNVEGLDQGRHLHCYAYSPLFLTPPLSLPLLPPLASSIIVVSIIALLYAFIVPLNTFAM